MGLNPRTRPESGCREVLCRTLLGCISLCAGRASPTGGVFTGVVTGVFTGVFVPGEGADCSPAEELQGVDGFVFFFREEFFLGVFGCSSTEGSLEGAGSGSTEDCCKKDKSAWAQICEQIST